MTDNTIIPNATDHAKSFTLIQIYNAIKLTSTNCVTWKAQLQAILLGYDLWKYVDGTFPSPPAFITDDNGVSTRNLAALTWFRQDRLVFGAIVGTLSHDMVSLVSQIGTAAGAWTILATTYDDPSRGHLKQIKSHLTQLTHTTQSITLYAIHQAMH